MKNLKILSIHLIVFASLTLPLTLMAQSNNPTGGTNTGGQTTIGASIKNPFNGGDDIMSLIDAILNNIVMPIAAVAVVAWIVWAGFQFVMAQGKPAEIQKAQQNLLWSLVGAGILLGAAGIATVLKNTVLALKG